MAITFDQTIGSRLNFLHEFPEAVFLGVDRNPNLVTRKSGGPDLSKGLKWT